MKEARAHGTIRLYNGRHPRRITSRRDRLLHSKMRPKMAPDTPKLLRPFEYEPIHRQRFDLALELHDLAGGEAYLRLPLDRPCFRPVERGGCQIGGQKGYRA